MKRTLLCSDFWLDVLFPERCPCCERVIAWNESVCGDCREKLEYIAERPWQAIFPCRVGKHDVSFDYVNALFYYHETARRGLLSLKYSCAFKFADFAAEQLALKLENDEIYGIDLVTAVPMNRFKQANRSYNQAEVFAKYMAKHMRLKTDFSILKRRFSFKAQHDLKGSERMKFAESLYFSRLPAGALAGKRILLCDDVFTSGSTLAVCTKILKSLGADKVYVVTICKTPNKDDLRSIKRLKSE